MARTNFARADQLSAEFISWVIRLSGEDFNGALVDSVFNEDTAIAFVNALLNELEHTGLVDSTPDQLAQGFQVLLNHTLIPPLVQDDRHAEDDTGFEDMYEDFVNDNCAPGDEEDEPDLHQHPDDMIDIEAEEAFVSDKSDSGNSKPGPSDDEDEEGSEHTAVV